jgi:serine/threonine protein phosphatase PrpC
VTISATVVTHPGLVRAENQDSALVPGFCSAGVIGTPVTFRAGPEGLPALYAVIDGMGGHANGRLASRSVAFYLADWAAGESRHGFDVPAMLDGANRMLYERMKRDQELSGMGATIAGLAVSDGAATAFNVGDARVYQYSDGYLMLLTTDDRSSPSSHAVTQSLGGETRLTAISPHTVALEPLRAGDRLLICSDGLTEVAAFDEIGAALAVPGPAAAAARLLHATLAGGAPDNVTFIVLEKQAA